MSRCKAMGLEICFHEKSCREQATTERDAHELEEPTPSEMVAGTYSPRSTGPNTPASLS